jgi:hypothetical protein
VTARRASLLVGAGTVVAGVVLVALAGPAAADNCGTPSDCFDTAETLIEALLGISFLEAVSLALSMIPYIGTAKGLIEAATGEDLVTGRQLSDSERLLGAIPWGRLFKGGRAFARADPPSGRVPLSWRGAAGDVPRRPGTPPPLFPDSPSPAGAAPRAGDPPPLKEAPRSLSGPPADQVPEEAEPRWGRTIDWGTPPEQRRAETAQPVGPDPPFEGIGEGLPKSKTGRFFDVIAHIFDRLS